VEEGDVALEQHDQQPKPIRIKGMTVRSYLNYVARHEHGDAILARLPADTAALVSNPPLPATWLSWQYVQDIVVAVENVEGLEGVRRLSEIAIVEARRPYMRLLEGLIRLFGTSPATIFKHMNDVVKNAIENTEYIYAATSARSGTMEVAYGGDNEIPFCIFVGGRTALTGIFDACGVKGFVSEPERLGPRNVKYRVQW
jgi:hypothetical protein